MFILRALVIGIALLTSASAYVLPQQQASSNPLSLKPCTVGRSGRPIECGRFIVGENPKLPNGRQISLNLMVVRRTSGTAREALFLLAGGPGQGSTSMVGTAAGWMQPALESMDIVLMDQRGTGESGAIACESDVATNPARAFGHVMDPEVIRSCRAAFEPKVDLTQYTTDAAVADMEALRRAMGYERIALFGGSYGTRLAQAYLRRHPTRTKAAVLDGVVPFDGPPQINYARSLQQSVDRVIATCSETPACRSANPNLAKDFQAILARLDRGPVIARVASRTGAVVDVRMTKQDFAYAVRGILYSDDAVHELPPMITQAAATGDLSEFARRYWSRAVNLGRSIARGMHLSVFCAEDIAFAREADVEAASRGTFMGRYVFDDYRRACALWPRADVAPDFRTPVSARVPVLIVSGRYDPVTPPEFGDRVAKSLPMARHIVSPTGSHGSGSGCPRAAVLHVLIQGTLEGMPDVCR